MRLYPPWPESKVWHLKGHSDGLGTQVTCLCGYTHNTQHNVNPQAHIDAFPDLSMYVLKYTHTHTHTLLYPLTHAHTHSHTWSVFLGNSLKGLKPIPNHREFYPSLSSVLMLKQAKWTSSNLATGNLDRPIITQTDPNWSHLNALDKENLTI